jgi:Ca2+-binding EF-hand superfamily protein
MRKLTLSIGAAVLATAGVAVAAPSIMQADTRGADMTRAQVQATAAEHFAKMDANGDGKLDGADRSARQAKMFDRIDADHDGAISRDEFTARHQNRGADGARAGRDGSEHHRMGGHRMRGHRGGHGGMMGMARMADTDNDGAITQAEFSAAALAHFDKADADHNGTVTQAERQSARKAMKAQWKAKAEQRRAAGQTQAN